MKTRELPSKEYLNECFSYNPLSGLLKWKKRPRNHFIDDHAHKRFNTIYAGTYAGTKISGYVAIGINGIRYKAHRIIWKLVTGKDPVNLIDHINTIESDNTFDNLRDSTHGQNQANTSVFKNNNLGIKGVKKTKCGYMARLCQKSLGTFKTAEEAKEAYDKAALLKYGEFARS